jgi:hypothetical protein
MIEQHEEAQVRELLAPLGRIVPVSLHHQRRPRWRLVALAVVLVLTFSAAAVAIAAGVGAFSGISAAQHSRGSEDVVDSETAAMLQHSLGGVRPDTTRLVGQLPSGRRIYVATNTRNDLCIVIQQAALSCGRALSAAQPITVARFDPGSVGTDKPINYGVALDGVSAISFMAGGHQVTVPVHDNVWAYEGDAAALESATVHFADGTTLVLSRH